jgi:anti-sigma factor RsiW
MDCREARQLAEAFVSEQLLVETTQAVVAHLDRCPACRAEFDGLRRLRQATRSAITGASDLAPSPAFTAALTARLREAADRMPADQAARPVPRVSRRQWLAIAAGTLLPVGAGAGWYGWSAASLSALLHTAVGDHRFCALTFKLAERPISLAEAARRFGGVYASLASVEPSTTALSGGPLEILDRHSCVLDGRRFAHIVLRYKGEKVSLLVGDDPRPGAGVWSRMGVDHATPETLPATDGFRVASFHGPQRVVFVVSSLPQHDVQEVARVMSGPVSQRLAGA